MVGPNYHRPDAPVAATWKTEGPWRQGEPSDQIGKGDWWTIFGDSEFNSLETAGCSRKPRYPGRHTRLEQARAQARIAVAALYPQASTGPTVGRGSGLRQSPVQSAVRPPLSTLTSNTFEIPFTVNWEPDFFGRIRRNIESLQASYQASGADLANTQLTIAAEVGADYFSLRQLDTQIAVLDRRSPRSKKACNSSKTGSRAALPPVSMSLRNNSAGRHAHTGHFAATTTRAIGRRHCRLIGQPAPTFRLAFSEISARLPAVIPSGVPSDLLERRPDIAEAERQMAAANAQIGVAMAAYYPSFPISLAGGLKASA